MNLALFDLDNTLLSCDTDVEWLAFLIEEGAVASTEGEANALMDARYREGSVGPTEYVRFYLRYYPPHDMATLLAWRERFVRDRIVPRIAVAARALIESHGADLSVIVTATNRFLTEPIAAALGVAHLIATEPQIADGRFTGEVEGVPCMREGKVARLKAWLRARGKTLGRYQSWFYSDSTNDLPLLERVTHPVAVDPDPQLRKIAQTRGWQIVSLREVNAPQTEAFKPGEA